MLTTILFLLLNLQPVAEPDTIGYIYVIKVDTICRNGVQFVLEEKIEVRYSKFNSEMDSTDLFIWNEAMRRHEALLNGWKYESEYYLYCRPIIKRR